MSLIPSSVTRQRAGNEPLCAIGSRSRQQGAIGSSPMATASGQVEKNVRDARRHAVGVRPRTTHVAADASLSGPERAE